ncbi:MAG: DUF2007 domain-containing protein [Cytophagales bacterium]|nr:DUF2007 domain-containing protein [Cytophagales bacterium]
MIFSTQSEDWQIIHKSENAMQMELLKNELQNNEIECVLINKKDSIYPVFGAYFVYVRTKDMDAARIITEAFLNEHDEETR